jgi:hypothetical protein
MDIKKILSDTRTSQAAIGVTGKVFLKLLPIFEEAYNKSKKKNPYRGGRPEKLRRMEEKLFFVLYYLKNYPTYDVMGMQFGFNRSSAFKRVQEYMRVLQLALKKNKSLPAESLKSLRTIIGDEKLVIIDGTEQRKNRPKDKKKQKEYYSGKKNTIL